MKASLEKVLNALRRFKSKGVTFDTFAKGSPWHNVDYRKRLSEARRLPGCVIKDTWERFNNGCRYKRYVMIKEPK